MKDAARTEVVANRVPCSETAWVAARMRERYSAELASRLGGGAS